MRQNRLSRFTTAHLFPDSSLATIARSLIVFTPCHDICHVVQYFMSGSFSQPGQPLHVLQIV